jgi:hypothetical protein
MAVDWAYVPELIDEEQLADLRSSIETEYVRDLYAGLMPYRTARPGYTVASLDENDREYIVTSSGCYERFFEFGIFAHRPPDPELRVHSTFETSRAFYKALFSGHGGWEPVYDVDTGNGPRVVIFARGEALERHGSQAMELP